MRASREEQRRVSETLAEGERLAGRQRYVSGTTTITSDDALRRDAPRIHSADPYKLEARAEQAQRNTSELYLESMRRDRKEKQRRLELVAAERDPFTARLIKDWSRDHDATTINAFDEYNTTIEYNATAGEYRQRPFQFWADGYQVESTYDGNSTSIDDIRRERVERFRAKVDNDLRQATTSAKDDVSAQDDEVQNPRVVPALKVAPPLNACYFLSLTLSPRDRQAIVGDLIEEYREYIVPEFGERRARTWFWTQAARSILAIMSRRVVKLATGLVAWRAVSSVFRRFVG